jgi:hypothetical protein
MPAVAAAAQAHQALEACLSAAEACHGKKQMESFRVWVQPMDCEYRVSVEGAQNASWLINELSRSFVFKSALPLANDRQSELHSFQVPYNSLLPFAMFRRILTAIPGVQLTMQTAVA